MVIRLTRKNGKQSPYFSIPFKRKELERATIEDLLRLVERKRIPIKSVLIELLEGKTITI